MLYHLFTWLDKNYDVPGAGLFQYQTFRISMAILLSLVIATVYGRKIIDYILVNGQTSLQYLMNVSKKYRQIATEAIFECLRLGYPLNNMEITGKARELQRKRNAYV